MERLGFNDTLLLLTVAGLGAFALGIVLADSAAFMEAGDDNAKTLRSVGTLFKDLGMVAAGAGLVLAAIRAEGHSTAIRGLMLVLGILLAFMMLRVSFGAGIGN